MTKDERKQRPMFYGVRAYFPDALMEVAHVSWVGNEQHNPGEPLHWDRSKSADDLDAADRHLTDRARGEVYDVEADGKRTRHLAKAAWRILAALQKEIEEDQEVEDFYVDNDESLWDARAYQDFNDWLEGRG